jgi:hypothetical protein
MSDEPKTNQKIAALLLQQTYDERLALAGYLQLCQEAVEDDPTDTDFANWLGGWAGDNVEA